MKYAVLILAIILAAGEARAGTYTWYNNTNGTRLLGDAAAWNPSGTPSVSGTDSILFNAGLTSSTCPTSGTCACTNVTFLGNTLTAMSGSFTISGSVNVPASCAVPGGVWGGTGTAYFNGSAASLTGGTWGIPVVMSSNAARITPTNSPVFLDRLTIYGGCVVGALGSVTAGQNDVRSGKVIMTSSGTLQGNLNPGGATIKFSDATFSSSGDTLNLSCGSSGYASGGTLQVPSASNVLAGVLVSFPNTSGGSIGTAVSGGAVFHFTDSTFSTSGNTLNLSCGSAWYTTGGTLQVPSAGNVLSTALLGFSGSGSCLLPSGSNVKWGTPYGSSGGTGTYAGHGPLRMIAPERVTPKPTPKPKSRQPLDANLSPAQPTVREE